MRHAVALPRLLLTLSVGLLFTLDARAAGNDDAFNRTAAVEALSAVDLAKCKKKNTPLGDGHVVVTFGPTGSAQTATVDQGPFIGTKSEKCITKQYKAAKVPAFKGDPVTVGKKFKIE